MKRNLLILFLMTFVVTYGQTTIWSSDCENLVGWSGEDLDGDGSNWFYYSGGEPFGFESGRFYGSPSASRTPDNALFTPEFFIPQDVEDITLTLKVASSSATNYSESYAIYIQEVGVGTPYDTMLFEETITQGGPASVREVMMTIPNGFSNKSVKIIVRHYNCSNQDFLLMDDFKVEFANTLSSVDTEFNNFSMYPNPVVNELFFKTNQPISKIQIFDILGKKVLSFNKEGLLNNKINVSNLKNGSYIINVQIYDSAKIYKFIKK